MSTSDLDQFDQLDAALILDGLADILERELPPLEDVSEQNERVEMVGACRKLARDLHANADTGQSFDAAKSYGGAEWTHALLRVIFGYDQAEAILTRGQAS